MSSFQISEAETLGSGPIKLVAGMTTGYELSAASLHLVGGAAR